ncbi:MAG: hypothetical protein ACT452_07790 [Microthrixaceae bacterium]
MSTAVLAVLAPVVASGIERTSGGGGHGSVGHPLRLVDADPVAEPVTVPARVTKVATVPGSGGAHAWAIGYSRSVRPGWDRIADDGQPVFLEWTRGEGWRVDGPAVDDVGNPVLVDVQALAMLPGGEGWAVGANGSILHHQPGRRWQLDPAASGLTTTTLMDVDVASDGAGAYGWAVGAGLTILRLDGATWVRDQAAGAIPFRNQVPDLGAVTAASRDKAWALNANSSSVAIYERTGATWNIRPTGRPEFDAPPAPVLGSGGTGTVVQRAAPRSVAATGDDVWITGMLTLVDPLRPVGAERQRPFLLHYDVRADRFTSWCAPLRQLSNGGATSTVGVCDEAFPYAVNDDLPYVGVWSGTRGVAAGKGLYRFDGTRWTRLANVAGYAQSASFETPDEGWIASDGVSLPGTGSIPTSSNRTMGHVTMAPERTSLRRWPVPATETLEGVAADPGSELVVAVGQAGRILHLDPAVGWDNATSPTGQPLHDVVFSAPGRATAVGSGGVIANLVDGHWSLDPASGKVTSRALYGIAALPDGTLAAVGAGGTILERSAAGQWVAARASEAVTTADLNDVAAAGSRFVAVGLSGQLLASSGGWHAVPIAAALSRGQAQQVGNLLSADGLPDGRVVFGGQSGILATLDLDDRVDTSALPPMEGSVHTVDAWLDRGAVRAAVSVGDRSVRWSGDLRADATGSVLVSTGDRWRDVSRERVKSPDAGLDAPALRDAAFGFVLDGDRGWVVGGFPAPGRTDEGHVRFDSTASIWRLALSDEPQRSPEEAVATMPVGPGFTFAFLASSACSAGTCGEATGTGTRADVVVTEALRDIDQVAHTAPVGFVLHGGDLRLGGQPDDLQQFGGLLDDLSIPVFGALGDRDLFQALSAQGSEVLPSNGYYLDAMAHRPGPWGAAPPPRGIRPVQLAGTAVPDPGRARTHYAFDAGGPSTGGTVRIVVLDTSQLPLASSPQNPNEDQVAWLQAVLLDARRQGIPAVVSMHRPAVVPLDNGVDSSLLTAVLTASGASAVLTSQEPTNLITATPATGAPEAVPVGVFGGAGSPLDGGLPVDGAYHSWQLITVDPSVAARSVTGRAPVTIRSIPVLESLALSAPGGRASPAGQTLAFRGLGRLPDSGGKHGDSPSADPNEGKATYVRFPFAPPCTGPLPASDGTCRSAGVVVPDHRFVSSNTNVGQFVMEDPSRPGSPFVNPQGALIADPQSGLFCAVHPGATTVRIESGTVAARMPVRVTAGGGPCVDRPIVEPGPAGVIADQAAPAPLVPSRPASALSKPILRVAPVPTPPIAIAIAPPLPANPPAPPTGGAVQKEEEREMATEQAEASAARLSDLSRGHSSAGDSPVPLFAVLFGTALIAGLVAGGRANAQRQPAPVHVTRNTPREHS